MKLIKTITVVCLVSAAFVSCKKEPAPLPTSALKISALEAAGLLANDFAVIVDVREDAEAANGFRIEKAQNVPFSKIQSNDAVWQEVAKTVPMSKQFIFIGAGAEKPAKLADEYAKKGYNTNYIADVEEWKSAKLPLKK